MCVCVCVCGGGAYLKFLLKSGAYPREGFNQGGPIRGSTVSLGIGVTKLRRSPIYFVISMRKPLCQIKALLSQKFKENHDSIVV